MGDVMATTTDGTNMDASTRDLVDTLRREAYARRRKANGRDGRLASTRDLKHVSALMALAAVTIEMQAAGR